MTTAISLALGIGILALKGIALFLMTLGAIDLYTHYKESQGE